MKVSTAAQHSGAHAHHKPPSRKLHNKGAKHIPWARLLHEAKLHFGVDGFRSSQQAVIQSVLEGRNTLGIMPTGAGKSLTYQLTSLFLPKPVIVVSPLIALMQDQQRRAAEADVSVEKVDSTLSRKQLHAAEEAIHAGSAKLLYVTPERLENHEFLAELKENGVSLFVVDEAHVVSQWGHDFRPAYLGLRHARAALGNPPVLALTATATEQVIDDILHDLDAEDARIINAGSERTNLFFSVHPTVNNDAKLARLTHMIAQEKGSGIVYTASVRSANDLHERFTQAGIPVGHYHGKLSPKERQHALDDFMHDRYRVMIATKAFGLGIDKPDIRFVYHYEFPDSLETYYQEAGRAGRDGLPSSAVLLFRLEDRRIQTFFAAGKYPTLHEMSQVLDAVPDDSAVKPAAVASATAVSLKRAQVILHLLHDTGLVVCNDDGYMRTSALIVDDEHITALMTAYQLRTECDHKRLQEMMHYAETAQCRRQVFRRYFSEPAGDICGNCDNCLNHTSESAQPVALYAAAEDHGVTRIETLSGSIVTTAPQTLPHHQDVTFAVGSTVLHKQFGKGTVKDVEGSTVLVRFAGVGMKKLKEAFLQPA